MSRALRNFNSIKLQKIEHSFPNPPTKNKQNITFAIKDTISSNLSVRQDKKQ